MIQRRNLEAEMEKKENLRFFLVSVILKPWINELYAELTS